MRLVGKTHCKDTEKDGGESQLSYHKGEVKSWKLLVETAGMRNEIGSLARREEDGSCFYFSR